MTSPRDDDREIRDTAEWLEAQRPEPTALELDRIKQRALSRASRSSSSRAGLVLSRRLSTLLSVGVLTIAMAAAIAVAGKGPPGGSPPGQSNGSAANKQYLPGKGCGDKNHTHEGGAPPAHSNGSGQGNNNKDPDETDCKKPPE